MTPKAHASFTSSFVLMQAASVQAVEMDNGQVSSSLYEAAEASEIKKNISQALEGLNRGIFGVQVTKFWRFWDSGMCQLGQGLKFNL